VLGRLEQHLLEIEAVGGLHICTLADRYACGMEAFREIVADTLELAKAEQSWIARRWRRREVKAAQRIRGDERFGQLALQLGYLGPHRPPRGQLVAVQVRFTDTKDVLRPPRTLF
jgi:hypothetical protein